MNEGKHGCCKLLRMKTGAIFSRFHVEGHRDVYRLLKPCMSFDP